MNTSTQNSSFPYFVQCDQNGSELGFFNEKNVLVETANKNALFDDLLALNKQSDTSPNP